MVKTHFMKRKDGMETRLDFSAFPFEPYEVQKSLMNSMFGCMEAGNVGVFESPTGTGKSLSIIFACLTWLRHQEETIQRKELEEEKTELVEIRAKKDNLDWLSSALTGSTVIHESSNGDEKKAKALKKINIMMDRIRSGDDIRLKFRPKHQTSKSSISSSLLCDNNSSSGSGPMKTSADCDEIDFALNNYDSDEDTKRKSGFGSGDSCDEEEEDADDVNDFDCLPQILYCSRTHSQISQFVNEIKKSSFRGIRCVVLGSRRNLCINPSVKRLHTDSAISEECLRLQRTKKSVAKSEKSSLPSVGVGVGVKASRRTSNDRRSSADTSTCRFHNQGEKDLMEVILNGPRDIEDLVTVGHDLHSCPYYASRKAVRFAQVICMPYSMLMSAEARVSLGIRLRGNVVVVDEAHNLVEADNEMHSAEIWADDLRNSIFALSSYLERFRTVLYGRNVYYISLLDSVLTMIGRFMEQLLPTTLTVCSSLFCFYFSWLCFNSCRQSQRIRIQMS